MSGLALVPWHCLNNKSKEIEEITKKVRDFAIKDTNDGLFDEENQDTLVYHDLDEKDLDDNPVDDSFFNESDDSEDEDGLDEDIEKTLQRIIDNDIKVHQRLDGSFTPLHLAIMLHHHELIKILLERGASTIIKTLDEHTPLFLSILHGCAICVELLVRYNADVNEVLNDGIRYSYLLHFVVESNLVRIAEILLDYKADPNVKNDMRETPLHVASRLGNRDMVEILLQHRAQDTKNFQGLTALSLSLQFGHEEVFYVLANLTSALDHLYDNDYTILHMASAMGGVKFVEILLERGMDVNASSSHGVSPLHMAIMKHKEYAVEVLVKSGANVNQLANKGKTPLHLAIENRLPTVFEFLVENGSDIDTPDIHKQTPLHLAVRQNSLTIVKSLLKKGVNVNAENAKGETPVQIAIKVGNPSLLEALLKHEVDVNAVNRQGQTPLHLAVSTMHYRLNDPEHCLVAKLLENAANANTRSVPSGQTPLHLAVNTGCKNLIHMLLDHDAQINLPDFVTGRTPLYLALTGDSTDCARHLLKNGANIDWRDSDGNTPLAVAKKQNLIYFKEYLTKLRIAGLHINNQSVDDTFEESCVKEVKKMKENYIISDVTFYEFLRATRVRLAGLVKDVEVVDIFRKNFDNLKEGYPMYAEILERNFITGERYGNLMKSAALCLEKAVPQLLVDVQEKILGYLNHCDMKALILATTDYQ